MDKRIIAHYQTYKFNNRYWNLDDRSKRKAVKGLVRALRENIENVELYQVAPTRHEYDFLTWSSQHAEGNEVPGQFFEKFSRAINPYRHLIQPRQNFWGMTKPSIYSKAKRSPQEIDPFAEKERMPYFVIYPFSKTPDWYLKSREERQQMMNQHITLGKQYKEITQLLLYSFGLQDQEFVVAYETENLAQFSDLVYDLRMTEARPYTLIDTPIITCIRKSEEDLVSICC